MNKNYLIIGRGIFTIFVITALGLIIMNEKGGEIFSPKVEKKINSYIEKNYTSINFNKSKVEYKDNTFSMKLSNKKNDNHYFYISYKRGKYEDTYKEDYFEGKNILNHTTELIETRIQELTNEKVLIKSTNTLDKYTSKVQDRIIKEDNLINLKYYYLTKEITISSWNKDTIINEITNTINTMNKNNITPSYYIFIFTDENDITKSIEIDNVNETFINNQNKDQIIIDILNDNNSELLKTNKITYKKLN